MASLQHEAVSALDVALPFPGTSSATIEPVGGKGHSLIRLAKLGLAVPPGIVLTARFFEPWVAAIQACASWQSLADAPAVRHAAVCALLQQHAADLPLNEFQREAVATARARLARRGDMSASAQA